MDSPREGFRRHLDGHILTVRIPMRFERIGGRKAMVVPDSASEPTANAPQRDAPLVRALGRAYRWQRLLENGTYASAAELATAEKVNPSYLSRLLRFTQLAPDIVEMILNGHQPLTLSVLKLLEGFPLEWSEQGTQLRSPAKVRQRLIT